jgi:hypothetical protein
MDGPSRVATSSNVWQLLADMAEQLRVLYRGETERLSREWGVGLGLWRQAWEGGQPSHRYSS